MEEMSRILREKAKDELRKGKKVDTSAFESDLKVLVEELSIYQIELEHQNLELIHNQEKTEHLMQRYMDLFDNAPIGYLVVNEDGIINDINQTGCLLLGQTLQELSGFKITKFIHPDFQDIFYFYFRSLLLEKKNQPCVVKIHKGNSAYMFARIQGSPLPCWKDQIPEYRLAIIDVTIQKEMEIKLMIAKDKAEEHDKLKSVFLANMSHEIRTPMNGIIGFADLLKNPGLNEKTRSEYIDIIEKSSIRLLDLINELIDISKIESGQMQVKLIPTNIYDVCEEVFSFLAPEARYKQIRMEYTGHNLVNPYFVETDKEKLYAILLNLLKNAIKYTKNGQIKLGFYQVGSVLKFYIRDTGIGIPEDKFKIIFQRFRQVEETGFHEGTGLGLSIVQGLLNLLGGSVGFRSVLKKGSLFYFTIPARELTLQSQMLNLGTELLVPDLSNKRIIIAEDDNYSFYYLAEILKSTRAIVLNAGNGIQLMDLIRQEVPDIILLDINMPMKNGYECLSEIRDHPQWKQMKIICVTAYAMIEEKHNLLRLGCDGYIAKPYRKKDLFCELEKLVNPSFL